MFRNKAVNRLLSLIVALIYILIALSVFSFKVYATDVEQEIEHELAEEKMESKLILQIHDELLIEAPRQEAEKAREILEEEMRAAASLRVELETDCHIGSDWYEAK